MNKFISCLWFGENYWGLCLVSLKGKYSKLVSNKWVSFSCYFLHFPSLSLVPNRALMYDLYACLVQMLVLSPLQLCILHFCPIFFLVACWALGKYRKLKFWASLLLIFLIPSLFLRAPLGFLERWVLKNCGASAQVLHCPNLSLVPNRNQCMICHRLTSSFILYQLYFHDLFGWWETTAKKKTKAIKRIELVYY